MGLVPNVLYGLQQHQRQCAGSKARDDAFTMRCTCNTSHRLRMRVLTVVGASRPQWCHAVVAAVRVFDFS